MESNWEEGMWVGRTADGMVAVVAVALLRAREVLCGGGCLGGDECEGREKLGIGGGGVRLRLQLRCLRVRNRGFAPSEYKLLGAV